MPYTVLAFGSNGSGQLGIGHLEDVSRPTECIFSGEKPTSHPVKVAAGGNHTLLLCTDGSVYAAGNNDNGRCGISSSHSTLTEFHRVRFQDELGQPVQSFKFVAATWEASIFVTSDGKVFSSGSGNFGELGQGEDVVDSPIPHPVTSLSHPHLGIVDTAACMRHCVVVFSDGQVYGWGAARKGQLGEPRVKAVFVPRPLSIRTIDDSSAKAFVARRAVCCRDLTCVVEESGPSSRFVTLGLDLSRNLQDGSFYSAGNWKDIAASWSGVFVLDENHTVQGWGKNWIPQDSSATVSPQQLVAGSEHILVETHDGRILAAGWGEHGNCGEPVGEGGRVEDRWNNVGFGRVLGAGCATSWIFKD